MGAANATMLKSDIFHPEHPLKRYRYGEGTNYSCAACEHLIVAGGIGYSCDDCNFNIHEACLKLPKLINLDKHSQHRLTLTLLGASRWCDLCKETSHAGAYIYHCGPCNYDVHPRCTALVDAPALLPRQQGGTTPAQLPRQQVGTRRRRTTGRRISTGLSIVVNSFRLVDLLTGGLMSPVLDAIEAACSR